MTSAAGAIGEGPGQVKADFLTAFRGRFSGVLRWEDLNELWRAVRRTAGDGWYLYAIGEPLPTQPASAEQVERFIVELDALLRREHHEDYCGIVYADDRAAPSLIKVFDPNNLGVQCGYSTNPPLPGWVLSILPPVALGDANKAPANRRRWWQNLWTSPED